MKYPSLPHAHDGQADLEPIESGLRQAERFETVAELFKQLSMKLMTREIISSLLPTTHTQKISVSTTTLTGTNIASA